MYIFRISDLYKVTFFMKYFTSITFIIVNSQMSNNNFEFIIIALVIVIPIKN